MKSTIITEYNFVCNKNYYLEVAYSIEQSGYIFGIFTFSRLADKIGRKPIFCFVLCLMSVIGIFQYLVNNFYVYTALGFLINCFATGIDSVSIPLVVELFPSKSRTIYGIGIEYVWVIVLACMAPISYFINTWREIRLFIFSILGISAVLSFWLVKESLTWLVSSQKFDRATVIIEQFSKFNRLNNTKKFQKNKQELDEIFQILKDRNNGLICNDDSESISVLGSIINEDNSKIKMSVWSEIRKHKKFIIYTLVIMFNAYLSSYLFIL
jgi:MFS family permease